MPLSGSEGARAASPGEDGALRLSLYTDLSLRLLLYLGAAEAGAWTTTPAVARTFGVSLNHLQKVARGLTASGYIEARQGRAGGVRLARPPAEVRLGAVVAELEGLGCLTECGRGPCPLAGRCLLKSALDAAERGFIRELDRFTLADVLASPTGAALRALIGRAPDDAGPAPP
ncbi:Rrf2 family transcriptional regulator [Methylobacterium platani]|uniref:Rrf2 family transcriptional regulator n=1 Tax=Methylobacterium platani TaxID=427683 RepID=A0A179S299_9HYPH|nr:Rrf2 family transcriptional regulator [Methylobacterium platani]